MKKRGIISFILIAVVLVVGWIFIRRGKDTEGSVYVGHLEEADRTLSPNERYQKDLEFLYKEIKNYYVNLEYKEETFNYKWDQLYQKYKDELGDASTEREFYKVASQFVSQLMDGHTALKYSSQTRGKIFDSEDYMKTVFQLRMIENKPIVVKNMKGLDILGYELVSINDIPMNQIINTMARYYATHNNEESIRSKIVYRNIFYNYFDFFPGNYTTYSSYPLLDVKLRNSGGEEKVIKIKNAKYRRRPYQLKEEINFGLTDQNSLPTYKVLEDDIGYIKIPTFALKKNDLVNTFDDIVTKLKEKKVKGVVIDLRYNGGGNSSYREILSYLTDEKINITPYRFKDTKRFDQQLPWRVMMENIRSKSLDKEAEEGYTKWWTWDVKPSKEDYLRKIPVAVLSNEVIFSSTGGFINTCLNFNLATVVGNSVPLSGFGLSKAVSLPSKNYHIIYPLHESRDPDFSQIENVVKQPDIQVEQTLADFEKGIDSQLEAAVNYLNNK